MHNIHTHSLNTFQVYS